MSCDHQIDLTEGEDENTEILSISLWEACSHQKGGIQCLLFWEKVSFLLKIVWIDSIISDTINDFSMFAIGAQSIGTEVFNANSLVGPVIHDDLNLTGIVHLKYVFVSLKVNPYFKRASKKFNVW